MLDKQPLNMLRKPIGADDIQGQERRAANVPQTLGTAAQTLKTVRHFPFRRGVEKRDFLRRVDLSQSDELHTSRIEIHVRIAAMIDVRQVLRIEQDVAALIDLN